MLKNQSISATWLSQNWISCTVRNHQLLSFVILAFGWSWALYYLVATPLGWAEMRRAQVLFAWGPLVAAGLVTWISGYNIRTWLGQLDPRDIGLRWYLLAVLLPLVLTDGSRVLVWLAGGPVSFAHIPVSEYLFQFAFTLVAAGALEEFGWRGFVQPRLQERWSALTAALAIGFIWAIWHLPVVYLGSGAGYDVGEFVGLLVGLPLFSIVMAWLYNSTRGRLLPVMLFHAMINAPSPLTVAETASPWAQTMNGLGQLLIVLAIPSVLVWYYGRDYLANSSSIPIIPGKHRGSNQQE